MKTMLKKNNKVPSAARYGFGIAIKPGFTVLIFLTVTTFVRIFPLK
jgi:hypothetical protein